MPEPKEGASPEADSAARTSFAGAEVAERRQGPTAGGSQRAATGTVCRRAVRATAGVRARRLRAGGSPLMRAEPDSRGAQPDNPLPTVT